MRRAVYAGLALCLCGVVVLGGGIAYYASKLPPIDQLTVPKRPPNIAILASDGSFLANRGETGGRKVSLDELSPYLPKAFVAIEDRRFYDRWGVDLMGLARAAYRNLTHDGGLQGGSTLTQQLAKNLFLTQERTISRKIQEAILSLWLEHNYSKDQILELYLNRVYFGAGAYGVEAAAQRYFGKSARDVSLPEAAMLAGLVQSPSRLAPNRNREAAQARAVLVIAAMKELGFITPDMARTALDAPTALSRPKGAGSANYAADYVMEVLDDVAGTIDADIAVSTTLEPPMQTVAERVLVDELNAKGEKFNVSQGAFVAMRPDGAVTALVGGRDYEASHFNRATSARRQPGSSFKPFVYLTALERGLRPDTVRTDSPVNINGWRPENYDRGYRGAITLRRALALSLNTVAVKLTMEAVPARWCTLDRSRVLGLDPGSDLFFQAFPVGDTAFADDHAADAADAQALNDYVSYWNYNLVNDGRMRYGATVVRVGDEVSAVFSEGAFSRCLILLCTESWTAFMTDAVVDNGRILTKLIGQQGLMTTGVTWDGNTTQANYAAGNVSWGAQIRSPNSWMLRLAGKDGFVQPLTTPGDIIAVGWGSIGIGTRTIRISYPTRTRNAEAAGTRGSIVGFSGDSQLDPGIVGNAVDWAAHFLDLELGGRVFLTVNRAVSGQNSAEQMTKLLAKGTDGASFWFIDACTNDIQGRPSAAPHDTLFNYKAMCDYLEAQSCRPIIGVPAEWLDPSLVPGYGRDTANYEKGADTRQAVLWFAGRRGYTVVRLMSWTGYVTANLRNVAVLPEPVDRGNLHPAAHFYKHKGWLIARAILSDMKRLDSRGTLARNLPINAYRLQNGWTQGPVNASYRLDGSTVHLGGTLTAGTKTNGTVIYKLPRHLWPARLGSWDVSKDTAGSARIGISLTGELILAYLGSGDYVRLDGITYEPGRV